MITSSTNSNVKNVIALQKKAKSRREQDAFVAEGLRMVSEVPKESLLQLFVSENFFSQPENKNWILQMKTKAEHRFEVVSDKVFGEMTQTQTPQGVLSVVRQKHYKLEDLFIQEKIPHLMILEDIQDPGNLGTILRAGEGAGVTGVVMSKGTVDIYNPKVIRSTMGSLFRVPFFYAEDWKATLLKVQEQCTLYAAHLGGKNSYEKEDYTKPTAFLIGNEANGLKEETAKMADCLIRIPMLGQVESLNAAVAASILMFETARQRRI